MVEFPTYDEFMAGDREHTPTEKILVAAIATLSVTARPTMSSQEAYEFLRRRADEQYNKSPHQLKFSLT